MIKSKKFYIKNAMFGAILLVLGTAMVFSISLPVPAAARPPTDDDGCNIGGDEPGDVFVDGEPHGTDNKNGRHLSCHGQPSPIPTSSGAIVYEDKDGDTRCHGVSTPSGQGQVTCNTNNNRK